MIDILTGQQFALERHAALIDAGMCISVITYMELWEGACRNAHDRQRALLGLRQLLATVTILPFTRRVTRRAAQLRTALEHGLTMLTSDKDYDDIPGLSRLNPRTA